MRLKKFKSLTNVNCNIKVHKFLYVHVKHMMNYFFISFALIIGLCTAQELEDSLGLDCVFELDTPSLLDFSNCAFIDPGFLRFKPMTMPNCASGVRVVQGVTPEHTDFGETCFSYKFDVEPTSETKLIVDFWYNEDIDSNNMGNSVKVGFLKSDGNWAAVSDNLAISSVEWQQVTSSAVGNDTDLSDTKVAVMVMIENALLFIDKISVTNVNGNCTQDVSQTFGPQTVAEQEQPLPVDENSCIYNFEDGAMKGLESCVESWIDFGSKVVQLPLCADENDNDDNRLVLTTKSSFLPSITQTNRALQFSNQTELEIRLWVEAEKDNLLQCLKIKLFVDSADDTDDDSRNPIKLWDICPKNRRWQIFRLQLGRDNTDIKMKILLDLGLYKNIVFVDYIVITDVQNVEDCYGEKLEGEVGCS